ncbi:MAG: hypothetical protein KC503_18895 [Myxococcales bacterium]|nr:hypothetical protein [Myxococcales bacterium]
MSQTLLYGAACATVVSIALLFYRWLWRYRYAAPTIEGDHVQLRGTIVGPGERGDVVTDELELQPRGQRASERLLVEISGAFVVRRSRTLRVGQRVTVHAVHSTVRREGHYRESSLRRSAAALQLARGIWPAARWADGVAVLLALGVASVGVLWLRARSKPLDPDVVVCPKGTRANGGKPPRHAFSWCEVRSEKHWAGSSEAVKHGPFIAYFDDGHVWQRGRYDLGRKVGYWVTYKAGKVNEAEAVHRFDATGALREMAVYGKTFRSWDGAGKPHGKWVDQGPEGKAVRMREFSHGLRVGRWQENDVHGRIERLLSYRAGKLHGLVARWQKGRLVGRGIFVNGERNGLFERWSASTGKLFYRELYVDNMGSGPSICADRCGLGNRLIFTIARGR